MPSPREATGVTTGEPVASPAAGQGAVGALGASAGDARGAGGHGPPAPRGSVWQRCVLHLDMDCFFAQVEALDDPSLRGRPLLVGGAGGRGVVASASYEARRFGARSAMPMVVARRLCPDAIVLPGRHDRYRDVSRRLMALLEGWTPLVEPLSIDEAYLDLTSWQRRRGTPQAAGSALRAEVIGELGLAASIGIGTSKLVAKLASKTAKPHPGAAGVVDGPGVATVLPGAEAAFLATRPVGSLPGVGSVTEERLRRMGLSSVGRVAAAPEAVLRRAFGAHGRQLWAFANGFDDRPVEPGRRALSIGQESTFPSDLLSPADQAREIRGLAEGVAHRLRRSGLLARTITLKVKTPDLRAHTRARSLPEPTDSGLVISELARDLWSTSGPWPSVRLLGVTASSFAGERQLRLDEAGGLGASWAALAEAVDRARDRFGAAAIVPAGDLRPPSQPPGD